MACTSDNEHYVNYVDSKGLIHYYIAHTGPIAHSRTPGLNTPPQHTTICTPHVCTPPQHTQCVSVRNTTTGNTRGVMRWACGDRENNRTGPGVQVTWSRLVLRGRLRLFLWCYYRVYMPFGRLTACKCIVNWIYRTRQHEQGTVPGREHTNNVDFRCNDGTT